MRTRAEVVQWIKDKGLYDRVKRKLPFAIEKFPTTDNDLCEFFVLAFEWKYTSEGEEYWQDVNENFLDWFGSIPGEPRDLKRRKRK